MILGEASYVTYMIHVPLYLAMDRLLAYRLGANARCVFYLVVLIALSIAIHYAFEKPLRNFIAKRKPKLEVRPTLVTSNG